MPNEVSNTPRRTVRRRSHELPRFNVLTSDWSDMLLHEDGRSRQTLRPGMLVMVQCKQAAWGRVTWLARTLAVIVRLLPQGRAAVAPLLPIGGVDHSLSIAIRMWKVAENNYERTLAERAVVKVLDGVRLHTGADRWGTHFRTHVGVQTVVPRRWLEAVTFNRAGQMYTDPRFGVSQAELLFGWPTRLLPRVLEAIWPKVRENARKTLLQTLRVRFPHSAESLRSSDADREGWRKSSIALRSFAVSERDGQAKLKYLRLASPYPADLRAVVPSMVTGVRHTLVEFVENLPTGHGRARRRTVLSRDDWLSFARSAAVNAHLPSSSFGTVYRLLARVLPFVVSKIAERDPRAALLRYEEASQQVLWGLGVWACKGVFRLNQRSVVFGMVDSDNHREIVTTSERSVSVSYYSYNPFSTAGSDNADRVLPVVCDGEVIAYTLSTVRPEGSVALSSNRTCYEVFDPTVRIGNYHDSKGSQRLLLAPGGKQPRREDTTMLGFELEVECSDSCGENQRDMLASQVLTALRNNYAQLTKDKTTNAFFAERDGSLSNGFEIVSSYGPIETMREVVLRTFSPRLQLDRLPWKGLLRSHDTTTCGLHVHIDAPKSLLHTARIVAFFNSPQTKRLVRAVARRYGVSYARVNAGRAPSDALRDSKREHGYGRVPLSELSSNYVERMISMSRRALVGDRYVMVNTRNPNTLEIRAFKGSLNPITIAACLELSYSVWHYAAHNLPIEQDAFLRWINEPAQRKTTAALRAYLAARGFSVFVPKPNKGTTAQPIAEDTETPAQFDAVVF